MSLQVQAAMYCAEPILMEIPHLDPIWLTIPVLAVSFLLWVLWNFWKEDRKQHENARAAQPTLLVDCRPISQLDSRGRSIAGRAMSQTMTGTVGRAARG